MSGKFRNVVSEQIQTSSLNWLDIQLNCITMLYCKELAGPGQMILVWKERCLILLERMNHFCLAFFAVHYNWTDCVKTVCAILFTGDALICLGILWETVGHAQIARYWPFWLTWLMLQDSQWNFASACPYPVPSTSSGLLPTLQLHPRTEIRNCLVFLGLPLLLSLLGAQPKLVCEIEPTGLWIY